MKDFINYNQALELKELGFNEPCFGYYIELVKPVEGILTIEQCDKNVDGCCLAPTFSQAFRFFRDKRGIRSCVIDDHSTPGYTFTTGPDQYYYDTGSENGWFHSFEEAESACLDKLIELAKFK